ncbi:armadillo-type protein [Flammula alnicola]|nr:armadillo-type protein [Flammula alnicola]
MPLSIHLFWSTDLVENLPFRTSSLVEKQTSMTSRLFMPWEPGQRNRSDVASREAIEELDKAIEEFLWLLSPYLMEPPAGKVLEWLVRRFRINEFNVEAILTLFLPYHESPHFAKMVTILQIKKNSTWSFLLPYKSAAQNVPRVSLVTEMLKNTDVARFVASLLPYALKKGLSHRVLIAFNAATLHDFIKRSKSLNEGTVAYLLPALLEPLQQKRKKLSKDAVIGSYILLASLSQKCELSSSALKVVVGSMAPCAHVVRGDQFISSLIAICEPQPELEGFTDGTLKTMLRIPHIKDELSSGASWVGSEKVLSPLVKGLSNRLEDAASTTLLEAIIATPTTPLSVIEILITSLLNIAVKPEAETQSLLISRHLLSLIQQRHPNLLQKSTEALSEDDESVKEAIEQLIISLSTVGLVSGQTSTREGIDMVLASANADAKVRTMAIKELVESITGKDLSSIQDIETIRSVLVARVQDSNTEVLEALYENPAAITPLFASEPKEYLSSLSLAMASQGKPKRNILRLHLTYLASSFWTSTDSSTQEEIFHQIFFPFLLFSKSRQKTAELVWDIFGTHLSQSVGSSITEWLAGCEAFVKAEAASEGKDSVDLMNQTNFNVAAKIAENIMSSDRFSAHLDSVISKLQDCHPYVKLMGYLIALALIKKLSGGHQIEIAHKILGVMAIDQLSGIDDMSQEHLTLDSTGDISLGKYIITKPNSTTALNWLQISVIAAISRIPKPTDLVLDWVSESASGSIERGHRYVSLMRTIYQLANASTTLPVLSTTLLQILFVALKDDALAFLAGIWSAGSKEDLKDSKAISLLHAAAFLEAHILEDDGVDFQTTLPTLLVPLQNPDPEVCQGALECISRIRIWLIVNFPRFIDSTPSTARATERYTPRPLCKRPAYLKVFHEEHLGRTKADKKRDVDYKYRVVCYLLSHVNALSSETVQNALLKSTATITNKARIQILLPTIQAITEKTSSMPSTEVFAPVSEEFTTRILSCFDSAAAVYLNEAAAAWDLFLQTIRTYLRSGTPLPPQQALVHSIENGLFVYLSQQRRIALCEVLLEVGSQDSSAQSLSRHVLASVLVDVPLIIHLLESLAPAGPLSSPRASKRVKMTESPEDTLPRLSLLVEILGTKSLPGSLDLITHLLDTLSKIVQALPPTQADVSYIEQLLMSAVESAASKINEVPNLSPSVIRLDILVEVIRVSGNPQTFHQALLLIASLARLAPDSVLYNVMPVFTFMGSNVFHRDDSYSFKVVQQTIDGIVPVMVSSLKENHSQPLDLYVASKEFLRVFTDAANHIPRHRRNKLFLCTFGRRPRLSRLLGTVCMLLLEKSANRIVRQSPEEVQNSLSLPASVFQHSSYELQVHTAIEILNESQRIVTHITDPKSGQPIFLEGNADGDHSAPSSSLLRRRAQALIIFVGYAFKPKAPASTSSHESSTSTVIARLITLATLPEGASNETKIDEISEAARSSMNKLLGSMSVVNFIEAVQTMLDSGDAKVQAGALELLAKRLPDVSAKTRPGITGSIVNILTAIKNLLTIQKEGQVVIYAFQALKSIATTICPGEEGSLTDIVPFVLSATKERLYAGAALGALSSMSVKLGPRTIPFFRTIISQSIAVLRGNDTDLFEDAFAILHGLLLTIPTFWGSSEVTQVVFLCMDESSSTSKPLESALSSLAKSLAKRTPAKVLLPTLLDMWQPLQSSRNLAKISAYFEVLSRALQHADRPTVLEYLRISFKNFLEALDIVKINDEAQSRVISAFKELTVKLNEAAFKPLFRRLYDWAFVEDTNDTARKVVFGHLYTSLLDFFKGLMVPYMTFLLQPFSDILASFTTLKSDNFELWSSIVQILTRTLNFDDGGFWRDDKLREISVPLTEQIEVCVKANFADGKAQLQDCFAALVESVIDDTLLKTINLNILMHTRSEDARVRIFALASSEALWRVNGGKLIGFVAETATFIAECGEDENDLVVKESFKLKDAVESVAGKIDGL